MKTARKRKAKEVEASIKHNMISVSTEIDGSTNRIGGLGLISKGYCSNVSKTTKKLPVLEQYSGPTLDPSVKIKLQLFPIDEGTRMGLEKDGYHPYLELILSARKKISSVIKHLKSKWGGSNVALGEPILFPYNRSGDYAGYRWTSCDTDTTAGEVHSIIGSPPVYRLRYGWFSISETKSSGAPGTLNDLRSCLQFNSRLKTFGMNVQNTNDEERQLEVATESKQNIENGATLVTMAEKKSSNGSIDLKDNEAKIYIGNAHSSAFWDDNLTTISIGGLLSEASLQSMLNKCDPRSNGSNAGHQPSQLFSDSLDACIAAQMNHSQAPSLPRQESRSSILDAEDTCHAFPGQKFSSSGKDVLPKPFKYPLATEEYPNATKVNVQSGLPDGHTNEKTETDSLLSSRICNDESSLGLSGIKWTESLGPFDLGLSSSRKIISGDNLSIGGIIS
ncbi:TSL-kinase interacting protein 1-like isoform X1 [Tripterygium wilfordii]|uniref:TSL-kinase interacting protein 1-like isoform X1 n=1 Tax=Tripterygium wilfordii TaxID=458696 RepID=A0A7J7C0N8_TRIWF|nr:TSL-kinase interacting protein 1 [Tripterygium wilfordii]XP_038692669.1 TSL-kinase interacting protein 1 [Tripterygium wilfordii]KAF5727681.1 TSL-kinase interacting protein 1-like isoform X1 [Tripterygium wilfordii]